MDNQINFKGGTLLRMNFDEFIRNSWQREGTANEETNKNKMSLANSATCQENKNQEIARLESLFRGLSVTYTVWPLILQIDYHE